MTPTEQQNLDLHARISRLEVQHHDLLVQLAERGIVAHAPSAPPSPADTYDTMRGSAEVVDQPAPESVRRLWLQRRDALAATIRRLAEQDTRVRLRLHGRTFVEHGYLRFHRVLASLRATTPFRHPDGTRMTMRQVKPMAIAALQGISGIQHLTGYESRAIGLGCTAAAILVTPEFLNSRIGFKQKEKP